MINILLNIKKSSMDYKNDIKKSWENKEEILKYRYISSRNIFIYLSLIFFLNYFFVWAKFFDNIFLLTLPFVYVCFLVSIIIFWYFYLLNNFKLNKVWNIVSIIILLILFIIFLLPFSWFGIR